LQVTVAHRERQILVCGLQLVDVRIVGAEQATKRRRLGLRLAVIIRANIHFPSNAGGMRDAVVQARIGALLPRELRDDDFEVYGSIHNVTRWPRW